MFAFDAVISMIGFKLTILLVFCLCSVSLYPLCLTSFGLREFFILFYLHYELVSFLPLWLIFVLGVAIGFTLYIFNLP